MPEDVSAPAAAPAPSMVIPITYSRKAGPPSPVPPGRPPNNRTISAKALKTLGATEEEVRFEQAFLVSMLEREAIGGKRYFVECEPDNAPKSKPERALGLEGGMPADQQIEWLRRQSSSESSRRSSIPSKALLTLGATIDDVRIEKALLVLGEAPGRRIPGGPLPRPAPPPASDEPSVWAPPAPAPTAAVSVFLAAFLPWGVLAPLNVLKLQLNRVSPGAHLWVPTETEQCQAACGIARMWASLFWSMQFANAVSCVYLHYHREKGLAMLTTSHKVIVGGLLLRAYLDGIIFWPIGLVGALVEWAFALGFLRELRRH